VDFHFAEQEIRYEKLLQEIGQGKIKGNLSTIYWSRWYRLLSGYGERPGKAFIVTLMMILFFPLVLSAIKIDYVSQLPFVYQAIAGSTYLTLPLKLWEMVKINSPEYFNMMVHLITPFSWRKQFAASEGLMFYQYLLIFFQLFLLGIQLPLMVLAVRRRFKR
jgi:hypothetical protein